MASFIRVNTQSCLTTLLVLYLIYLVHFNLAVCANHHTYEIAGTYYDVTRQIIFFSWATALPAAFTWLWLSFLVKSPYRIRIFLLFLIIPLIYHVGSRFFGLKIIGNLGPIVVLNTIFFKAILVIIVLFIVISLLRWGWSKLHRRGN